MKLSDLRVCDACGGPIAPVFMRCVVENHGVNRRAVNRRMGLAQMFGGSPQAHGVAAAFDGDPDDATSIASTIEVILCTDCFCNADTLAAAWQKRHEAKPPETPFEAEKRRRAAMDAPPVPMPIGRLPANPCEHVAGKPILYGHRWKCSKCGAEGAVVPAPTDVAPEAP